jgi:hypothetical protein
MASCSLEIASRVAHVVLAALASCFRLQPQSGTSIDMDEIGCRFCRVYLVVCSGEFHVLGVG